MQKGADQHLIDSFVDHCRRHRLKVTPQRLAIYKHLIQCKNHPSADDMFREIRRDYPNVSFDTVNRTLLTFSEIGLIDVIEGLGNQRRFDSDTRAHHHFHCVSCSAIIDFSNESFDRMEIPEEIRKKHTVFNKRVVLKGICNSCRNKSK